LNLPIIALGYVGAIIFLKLEHRERTTKEKLSDIDWIGSFLLIASTTSFLIPVTWGGVMYSWSHWRTLVPLIIGALGLVGFTYFEGCIAKTTTIPVALFRNPSTSISYFISFLQGMVLWSCMYYLPLYFQAVKGYTPLQAGLTSLPQSLTVMPCAAAIALAATKWGKYRWGLWVGWSLTVLGVGLLILLDLDTTIVEWIFLMLVSGIGIGLLFPAHSLSIQASVPQEHIAIAIVMFSFFRTFGQAIGVAVGGVIFQNRIQIELESFSDLADNARELSQDAVALIEVIKSLPKDAPQTLHLRMAFSNALKIVWAVMCGLSGVSLVACFFVKAYSLDQILQTEQGFIGEKRDHEAVADSTSPPEGNSTEPPLELQDVRSRE
jgi:hypothetical protein